MSDSLTSYPAYKHSGAAWLGDVPKHWETRRLKNAAIIVAGQSPPSEIVFDYAGDQPFLQGNAEFGHVHPTPRLACETPLKRAMEGDILLSVRAPVGALNIADREYGIGRGLCAVRPNSWFDTSFTYNVLDVGNGELLRLSTGSTYDAVTVGIVGGLSIPQPPLSEQRTIVRYLGHVDRRIRRYIDAKQKLIDLLEEEKQAIINQTVTRGLDPNARLKPSGVEWLGNVPEHWERRRLKTILQPIDRRSTTGSETLLSLRRDHGVVVYAEHFKRPSQSRSLVGFKLVGVGQLVVNRLQANNGLIFNSTVDGLVSPDYSVFERRSSLNMKFLSDLLRTTSYRTYFRQNATGLGTGTAGFLRLYDDTLLETPVYLPPVVEQSAIVEYMHQAIRDRDTAVARARRQIELLEEYRTRLIADVVNGKLDVREAAAQLPEDGDDGHDPVTKQSDPPPVSPGETPRAAAGRAGPC